MDVNELRGISLFNGLNDTQLADLIDAGTEVPIEPGSNLFENSSPSTNAEKSETSWAKSKTSTALPAST